MDYAVWLGEYQRDIRQFLHTLVTAPSMAVIVALTYALGIGANVAVFSAIDAAFLRPLPYAEPSQLVSVSDRFLKLHTAFVPHPSFFVWRHENTVFSDIAAYEGNNFTLSGTGSPERILGVAVSANFFSVLGIQPSMGTTLLSTSDRSGTPLAAILSYGFWAEHFGYTAPVIGRPIVLSNHVYTIVGVLPPNFQFPSPALNPQIFVRMVLSPGDYFVIHRLNVIARLKQNVSVDKARQDLSTIEDATLASYPRWFSRYSQEFKLEVIPLRETLVGDTQPALILLAVAAGGVLLIGCANVASLQLIRACKRQPEIAVRIVLGATTLRLIRQLLAESTLLAFAGGALGLLLAFLGLDFLRSFAAQNISLLGHARINTDVLIFATLLTGLTSLITGLAPISVVSAKNPNEAIKQSEVHTGRTRRQRYLYGSLVVVEIAVALLLSIGTGLLLKSFVQMTNVDLGFNPKNLLVGEISLPYREYSESIQQSTVFQHVIQEMQYLPGILSVAVTDRLPPDGLPGGTRVAIQGRPLPSPSDVTASIPDVSISPDYFRTMGISLITGRAFTREDTINSPDVVIINEAFSRHFFSDKENAVGKTLLIGGANPMSLTIVGIVRDTRNVGLGQESVPEIFRPFTQHPNSEMYLVVHTKSEPSRLIPLIRERITEIDSGQPLYNITTINKLLSNDYFKTQLDLTMIALFAGIALATAAVGVFAVISYSVSLRTREIGLRLALGARPADILRLVIAECMKWACTGIVIGIAGTLILARFLRSLLFHVSVNDPWVIVTVAILLASVAFAACYVPARDASSADPIIALRYE